MSMAVMLAIRLASSSFIFVTSSCDRKLNFRSFFGSGSFCWLSISFSNNFSRSFKESSSGMGESVAPSGAAVTGGRETGSPPESIPAVGTGAGGSLVARASRRSGFGAISGFGRAGSVRLRGVSVMAAPLSSSPSCCRGGWGMGEVWSRSGTGGSPGRAGVEVWGVSAGQVGCRAGVEPASWISVRRAVGGVPSRSLSSS